MSYLRSWANQPGAGDRYFQYLQALKNNGKKVGHSDKTVDYYAAMYDACYKQLNPYKAEPAVMLQLLGWGHRLLKYLKEGGSLEENLTTPATTSPQRLPSDRPTPPARAIAPAKTTPPVLDPRQAEVAAVQKSQKLTIGDIFDASILKIKGNEVTYQFLESVKKTNKEPKRAASLKEGQAVKVKISTLNDDGTVKKIELVES